MFILNKFTLSRKVSLNNTLSSAFVLELSVPFSVKKSPLFAPAPSVPSNIIESFCRPNRVSASIFAFDILLLAISTACIDASAIALLGNVLIGTFLSYSYLSVPLSESKFFAS